MKRVYLLLVVLDSLLGFGQNKTFLYRNHNYSTISDIEETIDKNFIVGLNYCDDFSQYDSLFYTNANILLMSNDKVVKEISLASPFYYSSRILGIKKIGTTNQYLVSGFGRQKSKLRGKGYFFNYLVDDNLNIVSYKTYILDSIFSFTGVGFSDIINNKLSVYFNQVENMDRNSEKFENVEVVLDVETNKFIEIKRTKNQNWPIYRSFICPYENKIKFATYTLIDDKGYTYASQRLSATSWASKPEIFTLKDSVFIVSSAICSGKTISNPKDRLVGNGVKIVKIDYRLDYVDYYSTYKDDDGGTQLYASIAALDSDSSSIFLANNDPTFWRVFAHIDIVKVGLDLKEKWKVRFSDDGLRLLGQSIKATSDGGMILCGETFTELGYGVGFYTKIDKNGNIVKTVGIDEKKLSIIKSYPNPTSRILTIEGGSTMDVVKVFTMDGKEVLKQSVEVDNRVELDLSQYDAGMYLYNVLDKSEKIISTGKVVKE